MDALEQPLLAVLIGAGSRGSVLSQFATLHPEWIQIVGVAEPKRFSREKIAMLNNIPSTRCYCSWTCMVDEDKFADIAIITTMDKMHKEPAIAFAQKGYHILLEKPMATSYFDCLDIVDACVKNEVIMSVMHVLRYDPHSQRILKMIESGVIGDIVNIQHMEPIGFYHFAHSFVRGNWSNEKKSSFLLLSKCCHDIDLLTMWMGNKKCQSVASYGSLKHFVKENKPSTAGFVCIGCNVEKTCPFSANKIYLDRVKKGHTDWPVNAVTEVPDCESVLNALLTGPYGRCVYDCDNNVVDNQVVIMQFEGGATASFTTTAFTEKLCVRQTRIFGTKGELSCNFDEDIINHFDFLTGQKIVHRLNDECQHPDPSFMGTNRDSDYAAMEAFLLAVATKDVTPILTGPNESLNSHLICFAAEKSRVENRTIVLETYVQEEEDKKRAAEEAEKNQLEKNDPHQFLISFLAGL